MNTTIKLRDLSKPDLDFYRSVAQLFKDDECGDALARTLTNHFSMECLLSISYAEPPSVLGLLEIESRNMAKALGKYIRIFEKSSQIGIWKTCSGFNDDFELRRALDILERRSTHFKSMREGPTRKTGPKNNAGLYCAVFIAQAYERHFGAIPTTSNGKKVSSKLRDDCGVSNYDRICELMWSIYRIKISTPSRRKAIKVVEKIGK